MTTLKDPQEHPTIEQAANPTARPLKVLVIIDGSEHTGRVIEHALSLAEHRPLDVVLLGIVRPVLKAVA